MMNGHTKKDYRHERRMKRKMMNAMELNMNELELVNGGRAVAGGLAHKPAAKAGYILHKITARDTVWGLSRKYHCSMDAILAANPSIKDKRLIRTNYWLYIPA